MSNYTFPSTKTPEITQIPNLFLDEQIAHLSNSAVRIMLYIYRHTLSVGKTATPISYHQFLHGTLDHEGNQIDVGAGICKSGISQALDELEQKKLIFRHHQAKKPSITVYEINRDGQSHWQPGEPYPNLTEKTVDSPENEPLLEIAQIKTQIAKHAAKSGLDEFSWVFNNII